MILGSCCASSCIDMEIYHTASVESAIELARKFQKEGKYDLFRGQLRSEWKLQSSLARAYDSDRQSLESYRELCEHFSSWVDQNENLKHFNNPENVNLFFALLQHHGIPTHYIDFTDDPGIAGFFSADGGPTDGVNFDSVIYLINSEDIKRVLGVVKEIRPEYEFELIDVDVSNLWRLQAQRGKFIYSNIDWAHFYYPPDRIIFPYTGVPSAPSTDDIYPKIKSALEQQLDQWFFLRRGHENNLMFEKWGVRFTSLEVPDGYKQLMDDGVKWPPNTCLPWLKEIRENFLEIDVRKIRLNLRNSANAPKYSSQILNGIKAHLERQPSLRNSAIEWEVVYSSGVSGSGDIDSLNRIWNGMRALPFSNDHIYLAIEKCLQTLEDTQLFATYNLGETVEFGLPDGSYSRAQVLDSNLLNYLSKAIAIEDKEIKQHRSKSAAILMKHQDPSTLFEFNDFVELFARELIASQILEKRSVVIFNPAKVTVFGLA